MARHREEGLITAKMRWKVPPASLHVCTFLSTMVCLGCIGQLAKTSRQVRPPASSTYHACINILACLAVLSPAAWLCPGLTGCTVKVNEACLNKARSLKLTRHAAMRQEYQPLVKKEAAYVAVDKNTSGSRPRELFEDAVEEAEAALEVRRLPRSWTSECARSVCLDIASAVPVLRVML